MPEFDVVIRGGLIVDGTRIPRYQADLGIADGRVAEIGRIRSDRGRRVLDARGLVVAPGFVDLHTHYDAQIFWDPYCSISSWHGITSIVIGNCGFGFAPVRPEERERAMLSMTRVEAIPLASMQAGMPWDWVSYPEFLDSLERTPKGINVLPYVPLAPLLIWTLGFEDAKRGRQPTSAEQAELCRLLREAMTAGACGRSAQRLKPTGPSCVQRDFDGTPMVTDVMTDETCVALARVLSEHNRGCIQMTLVSGDPKRDAQHYEELAAYSGRPVLYNVIQSVDRFPDRHRKTIRWLEECRRRGLRVYGQALTTDAGMTFALEDWNLFDDSPAWCEATTGTIEQRMQKLAEPQRRERLKANPPHDGLITNAFEDIVIATVFRADLKPAEGLTLRQAGERAGKHPVDAMLDLALAENLKTEFFAPATNLRKDLLKEIVDYEWAIFGVSDGGAHTKFLTAGRYPTEAIIRFVREEGWLSLEEVHWRLSALPAYCAGFADRGVLTAGSAADIVCYDLDALEVLPTEIARDLPGGEWRRVQRSRGYQWMLVNGEVVFEDGRCTGATPGRLLRGGSGFGRASA